MILELAQGAEDKQPGLLDSASPALLFGGGLALLVIGVIMLVISRRIDEDSDAGSLLNFGGWGLGIIGVLGIYQGLFGG